MLCCLLFFYYYFCYLETWVDFLLSGSLFARYAREYSSGSLLLSPASLLAHILSLSDPHFLTRLSTHLSTTSNPSSARNMALKPFLVNYCLKHWADQAGSLPSSTLEKMTTSRLRTALPRLFQSFLPTKCGRTACPYVATLPRRRSPSLYASRMMFSRVFVLYLLSFPIFWRLRRCLRPKVAMTLGTLVLAHAVHPLSKSTLRCRLLIKSVRPRVEELRVSMALEDWR